MRAPRADSGTVSVSGTITVDKLGSLSQSDIVDYSLTISSPRAASFLLTPADSIIQLISPVALTATATSLSVTLPPTTASRGDFVIGSNSSYPSASAFFGFYGGGGADSTEIRNQGAKPNVPPYDEYLGNPGASGATFAVGTPAVSSVPEPSSLLLMGLGGLAGLGYVRRRRRAGVAV